VSLVEVVERPAPRRLQDRVRTLVADTDKRDLPELIRESLQALRAVAAGR
jgi:ribosomal protein L12E/L44/L45/RPP1/RPP2